MKSHGILKNIGQLCFVSLISLSALTLVSCSDDSGTNSNHFVDTGVCEDECAPGERTCVTGGYRPCGDFDDDDCYEWGPVVPCNDGEECIDGVCETKALLNECQEGAVMCSTDGTGIRNCIYMDNPGMWVWGEVELCGTDETCSCGRCRVNCWDECVAGSTRCFGNGYQTCGDNDSDSCLEWGPTNPCTGDQTCSNGSCSSQCTNECTADSIRCTCAGTMVQICGNFDEDPCLEWSTAVPCPLGETCSSGVCSESCTNECETPGMTDCNSSGTGFVVCDDHNENGCLEWGPVNECPEDETCKDGECGEHCTCDNEPGICEVDSPHTTDPCTCDPDCGTPCTADEYCDPWCTPGEDPDCGCNCDFTAYCEAQSMDSTDTCPCDVDCDLHDTACSDDGYCDSWCPEGTDPDCGEDPCRPRYMLVGYRNADETNLSGQYTNPSPEEGAPWVLLSPGNSSGESSFMVSFAKDHVDCVNEIKVKVWGYDDSWTGSGAEMQLYDWNNEQYDVLPDEKIGSDKAWYSNSAYNPLPYLYCTTGQYAKCYIQFKLRAGWNDNTHFWDAYVDVYMTN